MAFYIIKIFKVSTSLYKQKYHENYIFDRTILGKKKYCIFHNKTILYTMTKKIKKQSTPTVYIDLHGKTVQEAFDYCSRRLDEYEETGYKSVVVITGKSGQIRKEFPNWLDTWRLIGTVATHDGSFTVYLR